MNCAEDEGYVNSLALFLLIHSTAHALQAKYPAYTEKRLVQGDVNSEKEEKSRI